MHRDSAHGLRRKPSSAACARSWLQRKHGCKAQQARLQSAAMTDGYAKILEQQKAMQAEVGKVHTHLMAKSRVTGVILPVIFFAGGIAALSRGMYQLYTGALL